MSYSASLSHIFYKKRYERAKKMENLKIFKGKIPFLITLVCCVTVAALAAGVRASDTAKIQETAAQALQKQVIVLDAGHPTYL